MLIRRGAILAITALGVLCAGTASAQPVWGHERFPNSGACFFENANFGGRYFCVHDGDRVMGLGREMNDRISSIRLYGNAEVSVWQDSELRGRTRRFTTSVRNLREVGWNDVISSLEVYPAHRGGPGPEHGAEPPFTERLEWGHAAVPREGACFYEDNNYRGRYFCVRRGGEYAALGGEFNRAIRSIRVFNGAEVRLFLDHDFRGRNTAISHDIPDLHGMWRDNIESVRVR
jgi:Peptidase inhibitor family I36